MSKLDGGDAVPAVPGAEVTSAEAPSSEPAVPASKRELSRREAVRLLAAIPVAAGIMCSPPVVERAWARVAAARGVAGGTGVGGAGVGGTVAGGAGAPGAAAANGASAFVPTFFTQQEWETVRVLVDLVLPADGRSGSATDAGVPEFMDFILDENEGMQIPIRGGLAWLDIECRRRFGGRFLEGTDDERASVLDDIAWPDRAVPEMAPGVAFFNRFRDLTASGFFSSRMGVEDLQYMGNRALREWNGCPQEVLDHLGVSYDD